MGKASRRKAKDGAAPKPKPVAFVRRPFEGLADEAQWVAMREIIPAATAPIRVEVDGTGYDITLATVLPMAWPAIHRADGTLFVALQSGASTGDASREIGEAISHVVHLEPGAALERQPNPTPDSPRLQDLVVSDAVQVSVHDGFEFWIGDQELDPAGQESMARANEAVAPTAAMPSVPAAYWSLIGRRAYLRWIVQDDEDRATDALARLLAAGTARLGESGDGDWGRLLGAFRAYGLLVPVWEVDPDVGRLDHDEAMDQLVQRFDAANIDQPLTQEERRARNGLVSRQLTLR